jgi:hypothetical protein
MAIKNASRSRTGLAWLRTLLTESSITREIGTLATGVGISLCTVAAMAAVFAHSPSRRSVDRASCDCTCWDGAFKNGYNIAGYKTAHFSFDERLPLLAAWLAAALLLATSLARHVLATIMAGEARLLMLVAILAQVYSHHYSFWSGFNYLNEGIWGFLFVQIIFTATEIAATVAAAAQLSSKVPLAPRALWLMLGVSGLHLYHVSVDWTTSNIGMPIMFVGDTIQAIVAAKFLHACLSGTATQSPTSPSSSSSSSIAAEEDGDRNDFGETGVWCSSSSPSPSNIGSNKRYGPTPPSYTKKQLQLDAFITVACICIFSAALSLWQGVSHEFSQG